MNDIYIINECTTASYYGIGRYISELIYSLHTHFNFNIVSIYSKSTVRFKIEIINNLTYWHIPSPIVNVSFDNEQNRIDYYKIVVALLKLNIKKHKVPIIFHINYLHCSLPLVKLLKDNFNCKIVTTIHYMEWAFLYNGNILLSKEIAKNDKTLQKSIRSERELIKLSDKVISLTEDNLRVLSEIYDSTFDNICVVPNGIRDNINKEKSALLRKKHFFSLNEKLILFAGRLDDIKGLHFLIETFKILLKKHNHYHLLVVGGGEFDKYIKEIKEIAAKVTFTGVVEQKTLFEYMKMADLGVMPSLYEPFGFVAVEMLMHELPIVATSSLKSILDDGINSKIVPIKYTANSLEIDVNLLAQAIEDILEDRLLSLKFSKLGRKKFEDKFQIKYFRDNMLKVYNSLINLN